MPVIVLLGIIPPMLGSLFFATYRADVKLRQEAQENIAFKAKILANTVFWWNQMNVLTLKQLSQQPEIVSMDAERQKPVLNNVVKTQQNLYLASTINQDGWNVARSDSNKPAYYGDRPWFLGAKVGKDITYQSLISRTIRKPAVCMGTPIQQEPSEIVGVVQLCTELSALAEQIGSLQFGKTGYALLVDRTGYVLAHPNSAILSGEKLENLSQYPPIRNVLEDRNGFFSFKNEQGIDWVSYGISLENGWNVVIVQQEAEFLKNEQEFKSSVYLVALVSVIAVSALTWLLANHLIRPISQLTTAAEVIAKGQLNRRVEIERQDELGTLATAFNQMAYRLKTSFKELEHRVRKRTAELNKAKEAAENANQTKDRFLARISHELRSPLNTIISYGKILEENPELMPNRVKGLRIIRESGIHLLNLIEDILDFSKLNARKIEFNPTWLHWESFLNGIVDMVEISATEKQLMFECEVVGNVATGIWADGKRLRQILLNLLNNAIKFTEQGKVTLKVTVRKQTKAVGATSLRFAVIDTGVGISPEHLEKIFQPFEQVSLSEQRADGTGLGLAISKQIVELMGSELKVKSKLGIGSTFWFDIKLPVVEVIPKELENGSVKALTSSARLVDIIPEELENRPVKALTSSARLVEVIPEELVEVIPEEPENRPVKPLALNARKNKILVVDDKEENHLVFKSILNPLGFSIVSVDNGQQALEAAPSVQPDLILLDLYMPVKTGFTLARELRKIPKFETIPIVLVSASSYDVVQKASQHLGCEAFLTKPIDKKKLLALLKELGLMQEAFQESVC